jgi:hypothetical protein
VFKKAKTPKEKKDNNNALEKTINKVRESLLNDIENFYVRRGGIPTNQPGHWLEREFYET